MHNDNNSFGYWIGRILAYTTVTLITLLVTGGGIALLKLLCTYILA